MKRVAERVQSQENDNNNDLYNCLSVILSSTPTDMEEKIVSIDKLEQGLLEQDSDLSILDERFRQQYQCRIEEILQPLVDSYTHAGTSKLVLKL